MESKKWTWLEASGENKDSELFWPYKLKITSTQINSISRKINQVLNILTAISESWHFNNTTKNAIANYHANYHANYYTRNKFPSLGFLPNLLSPLLEDCSEKGWLYAGRTLVEVCRSLLSLWAAGNSWWKTKSDAKHCQANGQVQEGIQAPKLLLISVTGCGLHFFRWLVLYLLFSVRVNTPKFKNLLIFTKINKLLCFQELWINWAAMQEAKSWWGWLKSQGQT